jgi:hypothetical protein
MINTVEKTYQKSRTDDTHNTYHMMKQTDTTKKY